MKVGFDLVARFRYTKVGMILEHTSALKNV